MYNCMCSLYECTVSVSDFLCAHADLSVNSGAQYYVVNEGSLFSWRGVTLCSSFFAPLSLSLKGIIAIRSISPHHFPPWAPVWLSGLPGGLEGPALLSRGHTCNHQSICWNGLMPKPRLCHAWLHACSNPDVLYTQTSGMNKPYCIQCSTPVEVAHT